jgi:hypothetical protein
MRKGRLAGVAGIVAAAVVLLMLPAFAAAQAVTTQLTATEVFDPFNVFGNGAVGQFLSAGTVDCPGAQPTGNPMQPCPPGSRMRFRNVVWQSRLDSTSPLLAGHFVNEGNNNFDADATGQVWGTFRINLDAGGAWEGTCTATRSKVGSVWVIHVRGVGRGTGGAVDGMHLSFTEVAPMATFMPLFWLGSVEAEVLAPPVR